MGRLVRLAAFGGLAYAVTRYVDNDSDARQRLRYAGGQARADLRRTAGQVRSRTGATFGSADANDATVEARVRSQLGPLEKRLDVPRVQVGVTDGQVTLHGAVPTTEAARTLENAVRELRGVAGLDSHLAVGPWSGATRLSEGRPVHDRAVPAGV